MSNNFNPGFDREKAAFIELANRGEGLTPINYLYAKEASFESIFSPIITGGTAEFYTIFTVGINIWTLPLADGTDGQVLATNGKGILSFIDSSPSTDNATYILQKPDTALPNAQALSDLENGVLGNKDGVIEVLQRVSGPTLSTDNNIARFDGITGQVIKDSKVNIDDDGNVTSGGFKLKASVNPFFTGFVSSNFLLQNAIYTLPKDAGTYDFVLTRDTPNLDGTYATKWKPQISIPDNSNPVYVPDVPIVAPIPIPLSIPLSIPLPGIPIGTAINTPIKIDPNSGDIETPGNINANDGNFDGDLSTQGDLSTEGSINAEGDISSQGNVSGKSFILDDLSELSNDFVELQAPFDVEESYVVEFPARPPLIDEFANPPDNVDDRVLQTAWRRAARWPLTNNKQIQQEELTTAKTSWTVIKGLDPIKINFIPATSTTEEQMVISYTGGSSGQNIDIPYAVDLTYGTLTNIDGIFKGFVSEEKNFKIKVKTNYISNTEFSTSSICLLNRYDNGFLLTSESLNNYENSFKLISTNIDAEDPTIFSYGTYENVFKIYKPLEIETLKIRNYPFNENKNFGTYISSPNVDKDFFYTLPLEYKQGYLKHNVPGELEWSNDFITEIKTGTGLIGGPITKDGVISIDNTGVVAGDYRINKFSVNAQGQLTNVTNISPVTTFNRGLVIWGDTTGSSLLSTSVNVDAGGDLNGNGASRFMVQQIKEADATGALSFLSGNYSLQMKLRNPLTNTLIWWLPTNKAIGHLKNDGQGNLSWDTTGLNTGNIRFDQNKIYSTQNIISLDDILNIDKTSVLSTLEINSAETYIKNAMFFNSFISFRVINDPGSTPTTMGFLYVNSDKKLCYRNVTGTYVIAG